MIPPPSSHTPAFRGARFFLSNFSPSPITYRGVQFPTVEHAYQAMKSSSPSDWQRIASLPTPALAKQAGRRLPLRPDFNASRVSLMAELLALKFADPTLRQLLLQTAPEPLIETNTWNDRFWGVSNGVGANHLGRLLTNLRDSLPQEPHP